MRVPLVLVVLLAACATTPSTPEELEGPGFRVDVPRGWREGSVAGGASAGGVPEFSRSLSPPNSDGSSYVLLEVYELQDDGDDARRQVGPLVEDLARQTGGAVTDGPAPATLGGLEAIRYNVSIPREGGGQIGATMYFAFQGATQYFIDCQSTSSLEDEISQGCTEIVDSFERT
jgi:hypothetical protein